MAAPPIPDCSAQRPKCTAVQWAISWLRGVAIIGALVAVYGIVFLLKEYGSKFDGFAWLSLALCVCLPAATSILFFLSVHWLRKGRRGAIWLALSVVALDLMTIATLVAIIIWRILSGTVHPEVSTLGICMSIVLIGVGAGLFGPIAHSVLKARSELNRLGPDPLK